MYNLADSAPPHLQVQRALDISARFTMPVQLLKKAGATCPLPYPEKFKAAVKLVTDRETEGTGCCVKF